MEILQWLILGLVLLIASQTTYLIIAKPMRNLRRRKASTLLDTSVLIDGRIISIVKAGFATDTLVIPRSVIAELQLLADSADHDKRSRARYGLDVVQELQQMKNIDVEILQDGHAPEGVDARLTTLAKKYSMRLSTIDYNLNKVASVEGVEVLNINELAQAMRALHLPGEQQTISLVQRGQDSHQGVGYLADGTMVVVEQASNYIGKDVTVEFTRVLQTQAGKMMFARRIGAKSDDSHKKDKKYKAQNSTPQQTKTPEKPHEPAQQPPQKPQDTTQNTSKPTQQPRRRHNNPQTQRKKSPEDSLIALANNPKANDQKK